MTDRFHPRPYQELAIDEVLRRHRAGRRRLLLHLPTGAGKTVVAALLLGELTRSARGRKTLFVAHRREIIDQTAGILARQLPDLRIAVEQGERRATQDADVVVASVQSLVKRKHRYDPGAFSTVIADECHRALAPTWTEVLRYFSDRLPECGLLLGMTATPRRTDGRSAIDVFEEVAYEISREELQDLGYLARMRYFSARADLRLDRVKVSGGDFQVGSLSAVMNDRKVRALTVGAWREQGLGKKTLAFCAGLEHAAQLAADLHATLGVRTAMIHGRSPDRTELLERFRRSEIDVLTNFGVLTEGFDDPTVTCVLMARPTKSPLVYTQCVGRGLRTSPGKQACTVIDIVDRSAIPLQYGAAEMAGLGASWRSRGRDPAQEARSVRGISVLDPDAFLRIQRAANLEEVQGILMELPPETVLAGLDGAPVLHYRPLDPPSPEEAALPERDVRRRIRAVLEQTEAPHRRIRIDGGAVEITLARPESSNERFAHLLWHLERVSGHPVRFTEPAARVRRARPRAVLRSMLRHGLTLTELEVDHSHGTARATILGLRPDEGAWLRASFREETNLALELSGQLAFAF